MHPGPFSNVVLNISWSSQNDGLQVSISGSYNLYAAYGNCPAFNKNIYSISMLPQIPVSCLSQMYFDMSKLYQYNSSNNSWYVCVPVELTGQSVLTGPGRTGSYPPFGQCMVTCTGPTTSINFVNNPSTCQYSLFAYTTACCPVDPRTGPNYRFGRSSTTACTGYGNHHLSS